MTLYSVPLSRYWHSWSNHAVSGSCKPLNAQESSTSTIFILLSYTVALPNRALANRDDKISYVRYSPCEWVLDII